MAETPHEPSPSERAAARAARNLVTRSGGDILGKLLTLVLFALLARTVSASALGAYVFAFAWVQIATVPIGLGFDRFLVRRIARDPEEVHTLFWNVIMMKVVRSVPATVVSWVVATALHHDTRTRLAVYILTIGLLLDLLQRTVFSVFIGRERGGLTATVVVSQRIANTALGVTALAVGFGVIGVAASYTISSAMAFALGVVLLGRHEGMPRFDLHREHRRELRRSSLPYAAQDIFLTLLNKIDAVILSLIASPAAVGRYGAAYRMLEATYFVSQAMTGSFSAMFTYLKPDSDPTVGAVFQRAVKLTLVLLTPAAIVYAVLANPLARAIFGGNLVSAAPALRILAPVVILVAVVVICTSLVVSRGNPRAMVLMIFSAVVVNVVMNVTLIPLLDERGAALAMIGTYVIFLFLVGRYALREVGGIDVRSTLTSPVLAGIAMTAVCLALSSTLALALPAGAIAYVVVVALVERRVSPTDFDVVMRMLRRRPLARAAG